MSIEQWAQTCVSVPELRDASNRLAAIDEYLARTSTEGRNRVAAAMLQLEVRIGELLGPAKPGNPQFSPTSVATEVASPAEWNGEDGRERANRLVGEKSLLSKDERHDFRQMAAHPEVVERVIESVDGREPGLASDGRPA
ncbi:MAG: hypothetical protein M0004_12635 [Actinomycetota bacterium]|nr:hypothetical protein [Actinomycetota bacterium]